MKPYAAFTCVGCGRQGDTGFYSFPNDPAKRNIWLKLCGVDPSTHIAPSARLCEMHFTDDDFLISNKRMWLKKDAVPMVEVDKEKTRVRPHHYKYSCVKCGSLDAANHSFHRVPYDTKIREQWLRNVGIEIADFNILPTGEILLCERHFSEADFTVNPQSKTHRRLGAMPLIETSSNMRNNLGRPAASLSLKINDGEDIHSSNRDVVFESSWCSVTLNSDKEGEELLQSKTSVITSSSSSNKSSHNSKAIAITSVKNLLGEKAPDQSNISSSRKKNVSPGFIDLTSEDSSESVPKRNLKSIHRGEQEKSRLVKKLTTHQEPLESKIPKVVRSKTLSQNSEGKKKSAGTPHSCIACGKRGALSFFKLPRDPAKKKIWLEKCGIDISTHLAPRALLCKMHFTKDDIVGSNKRRVLKKDATPSFKIKPYKPPPRRYKNYCILCGTLDAENRSFFNAPGNTKIREQWLRNIGLKVGNFNELPQRTIRLCDSHFSKEDVFIQPVTKRRRLRIGAVPLMASLNTKNYSSNEDRVCDTLVSSCTSNKVTLNDDVGGEEPLESKKSKVNSFKKLPQSSKTATVSNAGNISGKRVPDQASTTSSRENNVSATVDLTSEDIKNSNIPESVQEKNTNRIHRLKQKKKQLRKELKDYKNLLDDLLENKFVTKEGRKMIKKFRKNL